MVPQPGDTPEHLVTKIDFQAPPPEVPISAWVRLLPRLQGRLKKINLVRRIFAKLSEVVCVKLLLVPCAAHSKCCLMRDLIIFTLSSWQPRCLGQGLAHTHRCPVKAVEFLGGNRRRTQVCQISQFPRGQSQKRFYR